MSIGHFISVWLHILAATVWIGGMAFLGLGLVPVIRRPEFRAQAPALVHRLALRFRVIGWLCLILLILTGIHNLGTFGYGWADLASGRLWEGDFGTTLALKLTIVGLVLAISIVHDFFIGPRASALLQQDPESPAALRMRKAASWIGRINLLLGLVLLALAVILRRGWPG